MITIADTDLEETFKQLLQKYIILRVKGRYWREGRLILFKQNGFFIELILNSKKKTRERFEIPIPFGQRFESEERVIFDYRITTLSGGNQVKLIDDIKSLKVLGKNKFYDTLLEINIKRDIVYEIKT